MGVLSNIVNLLAQTLHPSTQRQAEDQLRSLELNTLRFPLLLLSISEGDFAVLEGHVRLAAALLFKNFIHRHWSLESGVFPSFVEDDRQLVRNRLLEILTRVPAPVQRQLCEALTDIAAVDFPEGWPDLIPQLVQRLNAADFDNNLAILNTLHRMFKRYRTARRSDELYTEINYVMSQLGAPLLELYRGLDALSEAHHNNSTNMTSGQSSATGLKNTSMTTLEKIVCAQILLNKIFYSLSSQDLPAFFEDHLAEFLGFMKKHLQSSSEYSKVVASNSSSSSEDKAGPLEELPTSVINIAILYATRYEEDFSQLPEFVESAWTLLTATVTRSPRHDGLANACMRLLSSVARQERHKALFAPVLSLLCDKVIVPNILIRESDLELFEDEPLDYVRTTIDTTASGLEGGEESRRAGAVILARGLMEFYEADMTQILQRYIDDFLALYGQTPTQQWRDKNAAVALFGAIAIKGSVSSLGVTRVNPLVNIDDFFTRHIMMDLQSANAALHPLLKVDAIRFVSDFRTHLTKQQLTSTLTLLQHHLGSSHVVVHSTAALALDRILAVRRDGEALFQSSDIASLVDSLINNMLRCMLPGDVATIGSGSGVRRLIENEIVMRALVRVMLVAGSEVLLSILDRPLGRLIEIMGTVALNPANPLFNHNLFEAIAVLARVSASSPRTTGQMDEQLVPALQSILSNSVTDFIHYVFQVLAVLVENWTGPLTPKLSAPATPLLTQPALWTVAENIPALTRYLQSILRKDASLFVQHQEFITQLLGIFQTLLQSKVHDIHGMALLHTLIQSVPLSVLERYLSGIIMVIMKRLQTTKSPRLSLQLLLFLSILATTTVPDNPIAMISRIFDALQSKLLTIVMKSLLLPIALKVRDRHERKIIAVGLCKLALSIPSVLLTTGDAEDESLFVAVVGTLLILLTNTTVTTGVSESTTTPNNAEVEDPTANADDDLAGVGSFWKLRFSPSPKLCPTIDQFPEIGPIFVNSLVALSRSLPSGKMTSILSASLDQTQKSILSTLLQQSNVSL